MRFWILFAALIALSAHGCFHRSPSPEKPTIPAAPAPLLEDPCALAALPPSGSGPVVEAIAELQRRIAGSAEPRPLLEQLGWHWIALARSNSDPALYHLAEACARCIERRCPGAPESLLLRGHVLHSLHRFAEAEEIARRLVAQRGGAFDHGLLSDVLVDRGRIAEAVTECQTMLDTRPCLQSYSRAAHLRWLSGDLSGARELMREAARAGSPRDRESKAWILARLALYDLQAGEVATARQNADDALALQADHPSVRAALGRIALAEERPNEAVGHFHEAVQAQPTPEHLWALADAQRASGDETSARETEARLQRDGEREDARGLALWLATHRRDSARAVRLAEEELASRQDIFTHDALALALCAAGRNDEAQQVMEAALAAGTEDARLFLHAGLIARAAGSAAESERHFSRARRLAQSLLPSERALLTRSPQPQ